MHKPDSAESLDSLCNEARADFIRRYSREPQYMVAAPGRVNLIGEHTDYNGGFVLPMAIERYVVIAAAKSDESGSSSDENIAQIYSANSNGAATLQISGKITAGPANWSSYVQGVVAGFVDQGFKIPRFQALVRSTVPLGGGLSSSAALEVAMATLLEAILGQSLDPVQKALLCQQAEHRFAGVPCGIMDQFSSTLCTADHLMLLDCQSQKVTLIPFTDPQVTVLIINSNVKHELTGGEYAQRRAQCETAARILGVTALREATHEQLESARNQLGDLNYRRARHVITEIERTRKAAEAISERRWNEVGQLMYASHASLKDDYEVSCSELDLLVELASEIGADGGVIGSRMTGGGFGGCTVSLVSTALASRIAETFHDRYKQRTGIEPTVFTSRPAQGARNLSGHSR